MAIVFCMTVIYKPFIADFNFDFNPALTFTNGKRTWSSIIFNSDKTAFTPAGLPS